MAHLRAPSPHYLGYPQQSYQAFTLDGQDNQWAVSPTTPVDSPQQLPATPHHPSNTLQAPTPRSSSGTSEFELFSPSVSRPGPHAFPTSSSTPFQPAISSTPSTSTDEPLLNNNPSYDHQESFPTGPRGASPPPDTDQRKTKAKEPFHWWWWWEIAAAILSITCMCLVIAILFNVQNKPLSSWPLSIQPNSAIAILTTVGKAAMMVAIASCISQLKWRHMQQKPHPLHHLQIFDDASRGPWGSLIMLTRFSLGSVLGWSLAIVTIAALGIEPSAQNILTFELQQVNLTNITAEMAVADEYFSKTFSAEGLAPERATITNDLPRFQAAILNGLSGQVLDPSFTCPPPATKCAWPSFKSLGMCATFEEVTEPLKRNCTTAEWDFQWRRSCTYTDIPGWTERYDTYPILKYENSDAADELPSKTQALFSNFKNLEAGIWRWLIMRHDDYIWQDVKTPPMPRIFITNFTLCEKTYSGIERAAQNLNSPDTKALGTVTTKPLTFKEKSSCKLRRDKTCVLYAPEGESSIYSIAVWTLMDLSPPIEAILNQQGYYYLNGYQKSATFEKAIGLNVDTLLSNTPDLKSTVNDIADTLTNLIRNNNTGDNMAATTINGTAFGQEQFVIVRWEWLVLPVLETILVSVLLIICIILTGRSSYRYSPLPQLKTSVIAYFAYPTSGWTEEEMVIRGRQTSEKLEDLAKGMNTVFEPDEKGRWKFRRI